METTKVPEATSDARRARLLAWGFSRCHDIAETYEAPANHPKVPGWTHETRFPFNTYVTKDSHGREQCVSEFEWADICATPCN